MSLTIMELARTNRFEELDNTWLEEMISNIGQTDRFLTVADILRTRSQGAKAASLLMQLVDELYDQKRWELLQKVLLYCAENYSKMRSLRERSLECIRQLNKDNTLLDIYFEKSGLSGNGDLFTAWKEFNTYYYLVPGAYVLHTTQFGAGVVTKADPIADTVEIDFYKKKGHAMGLVFAAKVLRELPKDHYYSNMVRDLEKMEKLRDEQPEELIKIAAKSFGPEVLVSKVKEEFCNANRVPALFDIKVAPKSYANWWTRAKKIVAKDKYLTVTGGAKGTITVREHELSYGDEANENIEKAVSIQDKMTVVRNFLKEHSSTEADKLFEHLENELKGSLSPEERFESIYLLLEGNFKAGDYEKELQVIFDELGDPFETVLETSKLLETPFYQTLANLKSNDSKRHFLKLTQNKWPEKWPTFYQYFTHIDDNYLWMQTIGVLQKDYPSQLVEAITSIYQKPDRFPGAFYRLFRDILNEKLAGDDIPSSLETMKKAIFVLEIESVNPNTKTMQGNIPKVFTEDKCSRVFADFLQSASKSDIEPVFRSLTSREEKGESKMRASVLRAVSRRFPEFIKKSERPYWESDKFSYMLESSKNRVEKEIDEIVNVKLPENSKAIGEAQALGDLSENAEFDAAKEERERLNGRAQHLKSLLASCGLIEKLHRKGEIVELGTKVLVRNITTNEEMSYSILGALEADAEKKILNYKAPFAYAMLGKREGETFTVNLENNDSEEFIVVNIEVLVF